MSELKFEQVYKTIEKRAKDANDFRTLYCNGSARVSLDEVEQAENNKVVTPLESAGKCLIVSKGQTIEGKFVRTDLSTVKHTVVSNTKQLNENTLSPEQYVKGLMVKDSNGKTGYFRPNPDSPIIEDGTEFTLHSTKGNFKGFDFVKRIIVLK